MSNENTIGTEGIAAGREASELSDALAPIQYDITDDIQAWAVIYDDGEVGGIYDSKGYAERCHAGETYQLIRLVPAEQVVIGG